MKNIDADKILADYVQERIRQNALEEAARCVETTEIWQGDQYGGWNATSPDREALAAAIRKLKEKK